MKLCSIICTRGPTYSNHNITADISRFMDENVHRSAYVICLGQFGYGIFDSSLAVNCHMFSSGRQKLVGNALLLDANDVIVLWRQSSFSRSWDTWQCIFAPNFDRFWKIRTLKGRFHRPGLTLQLANPRLRDNRGLSPACVPLLSVNLTAHLTCDLTSFR